MLTVQVPGLQYTPVYPICHSTSACNVCATCRGMALSNRRLECLPVACQNPEPRERLALFRGRDDCHFWLHLVSLHGTTGSASGKEESMIRNQEDRRTYHALRQGHLEIMFQNFPQGNHNYGNVQLPYYTQMTLTILKRREGRKRLIVTFTEALLGVMVLHICNPNTSKAEIGGLHV